MLFARTCGFNNLTLIGARAAQGKAKTIVLPKKVQQLQLYTTEPAISVTNSATPGKCAGSGLCCQQVTNADGATDKNGSLSGNQTQTQNKFYFCIIMDEQCEEKVTRNELHMMKRLVH